ncbi:MAG: FtsH protease activity modulator HflK [Methylophilaceae bacterium]|nr:FtsH protease activity modulator HflK [Methylophilaceae bacterium]
MANNQGGNRNDGPPDLDEILRNFSRKLNTLFGKNNNSGGSNTPPAGNPFTGRDVPILPILVVIAIVWLMTGFYIVDQGSRGVVLRFGKHVETTVAGPHWHIPYPIESVTTVNLQQVRTIELGYRTDDSGGSKIKQPAEALMLTDDENIIDLQFAVQYDLKSAEDYLFKNLNADGAVRSATESAVREVVGKSKLDYVLQNGREDVSTKTKILTQQILDRYETGINIVSISMQGASPPKQVQEAFDDVNRANQDLERQKNEGQAYANDVIPKARGTASRLVAESAGYKLRVENEAKGNASRFELILTQYNRAPEVTRQRLYIDAQEQILSSVSKVLVDQKNGNSMLYLPLDKLISASTTNNINNTSSAPVAASTAATVPAQVPASDDRSRDRVER